VGCESEIAEFEKRSTGAVLHDTHEDVFGFDVSMVDTSGVTVLHGVDELQHHILDSLSVTWDPALHDILVDVSEIAVFENEEGVLGCLEGVDAGDDVFGSRESGIVIGKDFMKMQFLAGKGTFVIGIRWLMFR
jgi:hypothetical protein